MYVLAVRAPMLSEEFEAGALKASESDIVVEAW